jgi:hypothetical protein
MILDVRNPEDAAIMAKDGLCYIQQLSTGEIKTGRKGMRQM